MAIKNGLVDVKMCQQTRIITIYSSTQRNFQPEQVHSFCSSSVACVTFYLGNYATSDHQSVKYFCVWLLVLRFLKVERHADQNYSLEIANSAALDCSKGSSQRTIRLDEWLQMASWYIGKSSIRRNVELVFFVFDSKFTVNFVKKSCSIIDIILSRNDQLFVWKYFHPTS